MSVLEEILNQLRIIVADVGNVSLETYTHETLYVFAGPEFEPLQGHYLLVKKVPCGLHNSCAHWEEALVDSQRAFGYKQCKAISAI